MAKKKKPPQEAIQIPEVAYQGGVTEQQKKEMRRLYAERSRRRLEALRLYEPLPFQERFHSSKAKEVLLQAGNQVGKSLAAFVEDARAATGQDPHGKYPEENGVMVCLGMDEGHIGRVIHKYLFRAGAFKIIKDSVTSEWRSWHPWEKEDWARRKETKPAPPLIPPRYIKNFAWKKRAQHVFEICELHNGWVIYAMGSKGEPTQGFQADLVHIDEDLERPEWYDEMIARLSMRDGKIRWSALPHSKNDALINLSERAEDEIKDKQPSTVVIRATIFDNPFMPEQVKQENIKRWRKRGEDEYRKRALGEMVTDSILMYPTFSKDLHGAIRQSQPRTQVQKIITENKGVPPHEWCRYMVVDPGHAVCAVTFHAVPPPHIGSQTVVYDELYIQQCTATKFGEYVGVKAKGQSFQSFIIDAHGGRLRDIGSGLLPRRQYSSELEKRRVYSVETGHNFIPGSDDVSGREIKMREWLSIQSDGSPKMLVVTEKCPNLCREFSRFKKKVVNGYIQDEGNRRSNCHAIETLEYAVAHGLKYVKPKSNVVNKSRVAMILGERKRRASQSRMNTVMRGGGPASTYINLGPTGE